jgi:dihydroorotase
LTPTSLRIILEHCTTAAALRAVAACGPTVAGTITAHHLALSIDDVVGRPFHFCKPVAKLPADRRALVAAAVSGDAQFFFGSDSAPHPATKKTGGVAAAGVFTQPYVTQLVLDALEKGVETGWLREEDISAATLEGFLSRFGREFYKVPDERQEKIVLTKGKSHIRHSLVTPDAEHVVLFREGQPTWTVAWKK